MLYRLRELGVRIAMDDFGTGYSSLSYLQSFPFDRIKIDRSFIKDIAEGVGSLNIVRAVAALAKGLGMETTAEGVETSEQLDTVKSEGCTEMQGFLFSRARPAHELERLFSRLDEDPSRRRRRARHSVSAWRRTPAAAGTARLSRRCAPPCRRRPCRRGLSRPASVAPQRLNPGDGASASALLR